MTYGFDFEAFEALGAGVGIFYTIYMFACYGLAIAGYVLRALGLYTIAKRRGINHPWMSWVPVLDLWIVGCISDQYRYVVKGQNKNKRKWLLGLNIAMWAIWLLLIVFMGITAFNIAGSVNGSMTQAEIVEMVIGPLLGLLAGMLPFFGIALAVVIIRYMAMYDLYTSCNPQNNVVFLVLSIFFSVTEPFFIFFLRKLDGGMPPRRPEPQPETYIPQQPEYVPPQDTWETPENE